MIKEKLKDFFEKKNGKIDNLIAILIVLIIAVITINILFKDDGTKEEKKNSSGIELATKNDEFHEEDLEMKIENILSNIEGVR